MAETTDTYSGSPSSGGWKTKMKVLTDPASSESSLLSLPTASLTLCPHRMKSRKRLFFFWPYHVACGILVPWPRIESVSPALEAWNFNHWTTGEVSSLPFRLWPPITFMRITFRAKVEEKSMILRKSHIDWNLNVYDTKYFSTPFFLWIIFQATKFCIYFFI